ncbi:MAG: lipopolysaccharide heptosyltransferase II [Pseudomonadales bacterium]|nr:lipopolysaccharide heptosyltransferase II [Pseudomonadales bacterium]
MKILIVGPSWVGDMVMAQSLFMTLRQLYADCIIDVLAPDWSRPLLERMPEVRNAIAMPLGHGQLDLNKRRSLGRSLRQAKYDRAYVLPNSFKSAIVPFAAKIPKRTGWRGEMRYALLNDIRVLDKDKYSLMVQRFDALAYPADAALPEKLPSPKLNIDNALREETLSSFQLKLEKPVLGLCPGAEFGESKQWPAQYYAAVAKEKIQSGWQVWIFGSQNDLPIADEILSSLSEEEQSSCRVLAGETSLAQAIDLLSVVDAVVSNDSGLMHVAAALSRPLVVLYGSTSPDFTPPLSENVEVLQSDLDCSPCFKRECPYGHSDCLKKINSAEVLAELKKVCVTASN